MARMFTGLFLCREEDTQFDFNNYSTRKTLALGILNISFILYHVFETHTLLNHYQPHLPSGIIQLHMTAACLQLMLLAVIILLGFTNVNLAKKIRRARYTNNIVICSVMIIVIFNVIIASLKLASDISAWIELKKHGERKSEKVTGFPLPFLRHETANTTQNATKF